MKSYRKELYFNLPTRRGLVNITSMVQQAIVESGVKEGLVLVNAMHITASVFINDDESGLHHDYEVWLEKLAPKSLIVSIDIMVLKTMPMPISNVLLWGRSGRSHHQRTIGFWS